MPENSALITSPIGVLAVLCAIAAFFFFLEQATGAKLFQFVPPLLFIYATPVLLSNLSFGDSTVLPNASIVESTNARHGSAQVTSAWKARAFPPRPVTCATMACARSPLVR